MSLYSPIKTKAGKSQPYAKWYVEFRDHLDIVRRLPGFTDKRETESLGRNVEKLAASKAKRTGKADDIDEAYARIHIKESDVEDIVAFLALLDDVKDEAFRKLILEAKVVDVTQ